MGKYFIPVHARVLAELFHGVEDVAPVQRLPVPGDKDASGMYILPCRIFLQFLTQIRRQEHRARLSFQGDGSSPAAQCLHLNEEIRNDSTLTRPVVVIKATPNASWEGLISALDEMQINQISRYQIDNMNNIDSLMVIDYVARHGKKK